MYSFQVWISVLAISNTWKLPKTSSISIAYFENDERYFVSRPGGPFLESPGNFSGPKSNIQIEI